ncbi:NUDIX hydrolase, conserved [Strigomonas culicis]|nr:NUDIX hydrolase, conserved [Strigomonas culicis]EPY18708.1 NUDIX hydrolase, conserved [Strigomonas culicis]|eukprot:EPY18559.1 NUDIX hydrolase, conserved [Strigomonas culicis]
MYRPNVCAFLFNENVEFLGCLRIRSTYFQTVQGGIEKEDTDVLLAAYREIDEEIGIKKDMLEFVQEILPPDGDPKTFRYTLAPKANLRRYGYIGQEQRILLFFMKKAHIQHVNVVTPKEAGVPQEFERVEWMSMDQLRQRCSPEKAHIFALVAQLAPPIAQAYLRERHAPPADGIEAA